ncbi:MAG: TetR/AcrR family transcriptional regulator C-terminal domain-containing protein [Spirochaetaceae bacterium]|nr:TetR/AcrR family transcriptional regulator C-terminal domain-containing protein [Spirochaetaceae bacterium]
MEAAGLYRQKLLSLRDSVSIFTRSRTTTPKHFDFMKNVMICLLHLGVKENKCMVATHMLNNYIFSSVSDEIFFVLSPGMPPILMRRS